MRRHARRSLALGAAGLATTKRFSACTRSPPSLSCTRCVYSTHPHWPAFAASASLESCSAGDTRHKLRLLIGSKLCKRRFCTRLRCISARSMSPWNATRALSRFSTIASQRQLWRLLDSCGRARSQLCPSTRQSLSTWTSRRPFRGSWGCQPSRTTPTSPRAS